MMDEINTRMLNDRTIKMGEENLNNMAYQNELAQQTAKAMAKEVREVQARAEAVTAAQLQGFE